MSELISSGGVFMYPLLICSVLIFAISIERFWFLQERLVSPIGLRSQVTNLLNRSKLDDNSKTKHFRYFGFRLATNDRI